MLCTNGFLRNRWPVKYAYGECDNTVHEVSRDNTSKFLQGPYSQTVSFVIFWQFFFIQRYCCYRIVFERKTIFNSY